MVLLGAIVNGVCIVGGTLIGRLLHRIPESMKVTVMHAIGLVVMVLGLQMGLKSNQFLIVILSLVFGAVIGEWIDLHKKLNTLGKWLEKKMGSKQKTSISQGFVTATLIFVIGAMSIIGALDSGIRGDHQVLFTKAVIDGFTSLILSTTLGIGVLFSAIPVMIYEGVIALFATQIDRLIPEALMNSFIVEMTSVGGIMIFAIGLGLTNIMQIRVANLLPGIGVVALLVTIQYYVPFLQ